jgi:hypothetical protein
VPRSWCGLRLGFPGRRGFIAVIGFVSWNGEADDHQDRNHQGDDLKPGRQPANTPPEISWMNPVFFAASHSGGFRSPRCDRDPPLVAGYCGVGALTARLSLE